VQENYRLWGKAFEENSNVLLFKEIIKRQLFCAFVFTFEAYFAYMLLHLY
jgi:hypothetical protein